MSAKSQHNNILLAVLGFVSVVVIVAIIGYFTIDRTDEVIQGEVEVSEYRVACKRLKVPIRFISKRLLQIVLPKRPMVVCNDYMMKA